MSAVGVYKLTKMMSPVENPGPDEKAIRMAPVEEILASETDPDELERLKRDLSMQIIITEDGQMLYGMPIPEGTPEEEIKKAEARGMIKDNYVIFDSGKIKYEGTDLYMYDKSRFLTGEEWVKISTEKEDELNLVMQIYNKI